MDCNMESKVLVWSDTDWLCTSNGDGTEKKWINSRIYAAVIRKKKIGLRKSVIQER